MDLVRAPGTASHLDLEWEMPLLALFFEKLGAFCEVIKFDSVGRGYLIAQSESRLLRNGRRHPGGDRCGESGARQPIRCLRGGLDDEFVCCLEPGPREVLIVCGPQARWCASDDYPWGMSYEEYGQLIREIGGRGPWTSTSVERELGSGVLLTNGSRFLRSLYEGRRQPVRSQAYEAIKRDIDIRNILPVISVPTLVMNRTHDPVAWVEAVRDMARRIPQAEMREYPGDTHTFAAKGPE